MKISARNVLQGKISRIHHGEVNTEVVVRVNGKTEIVSVITRASAGQLKLRKGKTVYAVIKASNVILAVD